MNVQPYDFRRPPCLSTEVKKRLTGWLQAGCTLAARKCARHLPFPAEFTCAGLDTFAAPEALAQLPERVLGYRVDVEPGGLLTLLVLPRPLVLALAAGAVGDTPGQLPEDRELTVVEENLFEYLLQQVLLDALREAWTAAEPISLRTGPKEPNPRFSRLFPPHEQVVCCTCTLTGPFGEQPWFWLLPRKGLLSRLAPDEIVPEAAPPPAAEIAARLEALVRGMPVALSVALGSAELPLSQLSQLRPGDVVVLDQRVSGLLTALIAGRKKYRGFVGRSGMRQAFQIESFLE